MNELLCRICAGFIWDKTKCREFRKKHSILSLCRQCKEELMQVKCTVGILTNEMGNLCNAHSVVLYLFDFIPLFKYKYKTK